MNKLFTIDGLTRQYRVASYTSDLYLDSGDRLLVWDVMEREWTVVRITAVHADRVTCVTESGPYKDMEYKQLRSALEGQAYKILKYYPINQP